MSKRTLGSAPCKKTTQIHLHGESFSLKITRHCQRDSSTKTVKSEPPDRKTRKECICVNN